MASARCGSSSAHANAYIEDQQPWALNKAGDTAAVAAVLGDCLEALRIVALLASPLIPRAAAELWRRLGLAGHARGPAAPRGRRRGAACPRARRSRRATRCSPGSSTDGRDRAGDAGSTATATWGGRGPSADPDTERAGEAREAGRRGAWCAWAPTWRRRGGRSSSPAAIPTCGRPSASTRTTPSRLDEEWPALEALARDQADVVVGIGEAGFDFYYEHSDRAAQEDAFRAQIALAHASSTARS